MKIYLEILDERVRATKAIALSDRSIAHMAAYGQAIMERWGATTPARADDAIAQLQATRTRIAGLETDWAGPPSATGYSTGDEGQARHDGHQLTEETQSGGLNSMVD